MAILTDGLTALGGYTLASTVKVEIITTGGSYLIQDVATQLAASGAGYTIKSHGTSNIIAFIADSHITAVLKK